VATASVVLADVTPTTTTDEATPRPARTETAKRGYVPLFTKKNVEEVEFSRRQKIARLPEPQDDDRRSSNRTKSLSYVSSLGNMLMDISRDEGASGFMDMAVEEACEGIIKGEGGPFGAVIVQDGLVVARAHNTVLQTNDPTAHAEVTCIRKAAARLGRFDLSDCVLYTSCYPCPMCFGAMHVSFLQSFCRIFSHLFPVDMTNSVVGWLDLCLRMLVCHIAKVRALRCVALLC
jgi:hypothetical protein